MASEVEKKIVTLDEIAHAVRASCIENVDFDSFRDSRDVERVAPIFRNEAIDQRYFGVELNQTSCQVLPEET